MRKLFYVLFFYIATCGVGAEASLSNLCSHLLKLSSSQKVHWSDIPIEIIYVPGLTNTKLRMDDDIFSGEFLKPGNYTHTSAKAMARLENSVFSTAATVRFSLRITQAEAEALDSYFDSERYGKGTLTCTQAACKVLNLTTGMWVPAPFNLLPFTNALYLSVSRFLPGTRVKKITFSGTKRQIFEAGICAAGEGLATGCVASTTYNLVAAVVAVVGS